MILPKARNENIAVQELENETLIYDFSTDKAYCLNETLTVVYRHCDGRTTFDELKRRYKYTDDLIHFALDELSASNLIEGEKSAHFAGISRREALRRVGLGTMFALPVISALVAPSAANAASACAGAAQGQPCTFNNNTQSDCCAGLRCNNSGVCDACSQTGFPYSAGSSIAECNVNVRRNLCCNTINDATTDGIFCRCP